MNKTTTYVLLGAFALLLIYVLAVQQPADNAAATQTATAQSVALTEPNLVWSLTVDQVVGVTVADRVQGKTTSFTRPSASGSWTVVAPEPGPADQLAVANQVATLGTLTYASEITATTDLSAFDVLSPTLQISVTLANGTTYRLDVGKPAPLNNSVYAVVNGQAPLYTMYSTTLTSYLTLLDTPPYLLPTATPDPAATPVAVP
ncbi:MAG: DUF4340 domain-containing protein [Anaerolineales bacterium]|nr:DUF4340 domain-containing protein [Anaerolineales bacterium]